MYCEECGKQLYENDRFCGHCATPVRNEEDNGEVLIANEVLDTKKTVNKKEKIGICSNVLITVGSLIIILMACFRFFSFTENEYVKLVKESSFQGWPTVEIGKAFDSFFSHPEWDYFVSSDDEHIVEFNGDFVVSGQDSEVYIQFNVQEDGDFQIGYLEVDEEPQSLFLLAILLEEVMGDYE